MLHFGPGLKQTAAWARAVDEGRFELNGAYAADGFTMIDQ